MTNPTMNSTAESLSCTWFGTRSSTLGATGTGTGTGTGGRILYRAAHTWPWCAQCCTAVPFGNSGRCMNSEGMGVKRLTTILHQLPAGFKTLVSSLHCTIRVQFKNQNHGTRKRTL